ncbi:TPA: hypothetical protein ACGRTO_004533 [Escherichia coli]
MFELNIPGKADDFYTIDGGNISLSIDPLINGLEERINNEYSYGPGFFDVAVDGYIADCERMFNKAPEQVWLKVKKELSDNAKRIMSQLPVDDSKPTGVMKTIIAASLIFILFGAACILMIPLIN